MGNEAETAPATDLTVDRTTVPGAKLFETVTLEQPIPRSEGEIKTLTLRKPKSGELRKLSLKDILTSEIDTILELLPRISDPILTDAEVDDLCPGDLAQVGGVIRGFFLTPAERAGYQKMIDAQT